MSRWFRVYADMVDDPKVQLLPPDLFKALINLWCLTAGNDGILPNAEDIAFKLRMKVERVKQIISALHDADLIETDETGLRPHNWDGRQFKSDVSNERVKQHRKRKSNADVTLHSQLQQRPQRTDTEAEEERKKDARPSAAPSEVPPMNDETEVYRRGKEILGATSGGMIKNLIKSKQGSIPHARAAIEIASTKQDPREYIGAIIKGADPPNLSARERGDAW
jgi:hypothetical protein